MKRGLGIAITIAASAVIAGSSPVRADEPADATCDTACYVARARGKLAQNDAEGARAELLTAYKRSPEAPLLFALGQVELKLTHCKEAIEYYEKFIATNPAPEQVSLAEQAIGAARMCLAQPTPSEKPVIAGPPPERHWDLEDTGLVVLGGAAIVAGAGLAYYGRRLTQDDSGTITDYDRRLHRAQIARWTGVGLASAGAIAIGVAFVRWRLSARTEITATAGGGTTGIAVGGRW